MTERRTIAVRDPAGKLLWFPIEEAERWAAGDGDLYRDTVSGLWLLLPLVAALTAEPGRILDEDEAVDWLTCRGHAMPEALAKAAERSRLL